MIKCVRCLWNVCTFKPIELIDNNILNCKKIIAESGKIGLDLIRYIIGIWLTNGVKKPNVFMLA
jgi:hypothetical protein